MPNLTPYAVSKLQKIEVLLLACSAGGFNVLFNMLKVFPGGLPIAIVVIVHRNARYETNIEESIMTKSHINVKVAEEKEPIRRATAYFAPAGYHLLIEPDHTFSLDISEPVNFCRPSIDVTLQSAADVYGPAIAAALLSGANQDGAQGMCAVQRAGGLCIVQDPREAAVKTMPEAAIGLGAADLILTNEELITFSRQLDTYI